MTIQQDTWNFLRTKGLTEKATASVMGNIQWESGFNPSIIEGGTGIGFGLCQWSYGRREQLESYGTDLNHQLNFLWSELSGQNLATTQADLQYFVNGNYSGGYTKAQFTSSDESMTIDKLVNSFCFYWERPNASVAHVAERLQYASDFYTEFTGGVVTPPSSGSLNTDLISAIQLFLNGVKVTDNAPITGEDNPLTRGGMLTCKQVIKAIMDSGTI